MGAGKSTIGKSLASHLGIPFIDSDHEIEHQVGKSIPEIFETQGEAEFRELETQFIQNLSRSESYVLSTGGGLPCFNDNVLFLNNLGVTIYLNNSSEILAKRIFCISKHQP
jgi:shikimate kinase